MIYRGPSFLAVVNDTAPSPPLPPPPSVSKLSLFLSLLMCPQSSMTDGRKGGGAGVEPNHTTARKPGPL